MPKQSSQIPEIVADYIRKHNLLQPQQPLIVAVSGGADSVVLLHILVILGYKSTVAHCNFGLRGAESDSEEAFVEQLAKKYDLPFYSAFFDTKAYCKANKKSVQQAARDLRYGWFEQLMGQLHQAKTALAHHASDQAETLIYRLAKGSGSIGMAGIAPSRDAYIRPLLPISKVQIEQYVHENKLSFCQDSSNLSDDYARNRIRIHVVPQLRLLNPNLEQVMSRNAERFAQTNLLLEYAYKIFGAACFESNPDWLGIDTEKLIILPGYRILLYAYLQPWGFDWEKTDSLADYMEQKTRSLLSLPDGLQVCKKHPYLYVYKPAIAFEPVIIKNTNNFASCLYVSIKYESKSIEQNYNLEKDINTHIFDESKLVWPLSLRATKSGDFFYPFDMNKKQKVSDFLTNIGLARHIRHRVCVLADANDRIVWLIGQQADARFCVDIATTQIWVCSWNT